MKNRSLKRKALTAGTALLVICAIAVTPVLFFAGCSSSPVETQTSFFDLPYVDPGISGSSLSAAKSGKHSKAKGITYYIGSGKIKAKSGGTINIDMPKKWLGEFVVPAKSISKDKTIDVSIYFLKYGGTKIGIFNFGPDGLKFKESATLQFDAHVLGQKRKSVDVYWLNEKNSRWEYQGTYPANKKDMVKIPIKHFSKYGVSD